MNSYARISEGTVVEIIEDFERQPPLALPMPHALAAWDPKAEKTPERLELEALYANMVRTYESRKMAIASHVPGQAVPIAERFPPEIVADLVMIPEGLSVKQGWLWDGESFSEPLPYRAPPAMVRAERDSLMSQAALRAAPLQDAVDIGEATDEEKAALLAWKKYRVDLSRVDLENPEWPEVPQ